MRAGGRNLGVVGGDVNGFLSLLVDNLSVLALLSTVLISIFPAIARLLTIELSNPQYIAPDRFGHLLVSAEGGLPALAVIVALGNGFIVTATLWGAILVEMIEGRLRAAAAYLAVGAGLCCFGIIHSARADGSVYLPWHLEGTARLVQMQFSLAYLTLAAALLLLSLRRRPAAP